MSAVDDMLARVPRDRRDEVQGRLAASGAWHWPQQAEAKRAGCLCEWFGPTMIAVFDPACPILHLHRDVPATENKA